MLVGEIYQHDRFYRSDDGHWQRKYFVVLALPLGADAVVRLLTSKPRPLTPPCNHGAPYPSYFLGIVGGPLTRNSWVDLRGQPDFDADSLAILITRGEISLVATLDVDVLVDVLGCAASADDTTRAQERAMRDFIASLH